MEILNFEFSAGSSPTKNALVGCVGSGDLEILMQPSQTGKMSIQVVTSVNGSSQRWEKLFERMFAEQTPPAVHIDIHDFGATPGVVRLRLEQAFEEVNCG
ncbi:MULTISPECIES: malonate decarboxylase subunit delta [unclassified Acinetobacter]|uniref:malonate decarboxylase subunit delta n=1 Tax=unclassified Acinetobacter TaxID=196816 RepID=UPI000A32B484|nr:malonate decarboxylase subunit delta [Acinetobacter sp. ANC 3832]MBU3845648.1 malonate decarboxylase subunit delta [Candidatus Acinetobacter avistercoris]OTG94861.1 malonate decarboxylase acyl carrier protein [Acinetobacter sp. ANC 3832]